MGTCSPPIQPHHDKLQDIQLHVEKRLMPEATKEEIEMNIIDIVDKNSGSQVAGWVDTLHDIKSSAVDMIFRLSLN